MLDVYVEILFVGAPTVMADPALAKTKMVFVMTGLVHVTSPVVTQALLNPGLVGPGSCPKQIIDKRQSAVISIVPLIVIYLITAYWLIIVF